METKRYYAHADRNATRAHATSEYVELAGRTVKLQYIEHHGERVEDAATRIKRNCASLEEELIIVRSWLRCEFNLPATLRAHCLTCFIKVFANEEFFACLNHSAPEFIYRERTYWLHWQSYEQVCKTAPLIAVSFRVTPEGDYFAVAQVWAARDSKAGSRSLPPAVY